MKMNHTYVGAFWGDRAETPGSAAQRLTSYTDSLGLLGEGFSDWVTGKDELLPVGAELIAWVAQQFNSTVTGRKPSLGAVLGLLSDKGLGKRTLEMQITCGIHSALPVLTNALVMGPRDDDALEVLQGQLAATIDAAVAAWEPDWSVATTGELRDTAYQALGRRRGPFPGPLTWLSGRLVTAEQVGGLDKVAITEQQGGFLLDARAAVDLAGDQVISDLAAEMAAADLFARFPQK